MNLRSVSPNPQGKPQATIQIVLKGDSCLLNSSSVSPAEHTRPFQGKGMSLLTDLYFNYSLPKSDFLPERSVLGHARLCSFGDQDTRSWEKMW